MNLQQIGWNNFFADQCADSPFLPGRSLLSGVDFSLCGQRQANSRCLRALGSTVLAMIGHVLGTGCLLERRLR